MYDDDCKLLSQKSDEDLIKQITEDIDASEQHLGEWHGNAIEAYDFDIGHQWSAEDKAKLLEDGRPPVVFNRICRTVNAICGLEVQNRQEINYLPRSNEDTKVGELLTLAAKWARDNGNAEDEESDAFRDCLVSGLGIVETCVDYDINPDGDIAYNRVSPFEFRVDPCSTKRNFEDARWCARVKDLLPVEIRETWPDADTTIVPTSSNSYGYNDSTGEPHDSDSKMAYKQGNKGKTKQKTIPVIHYQWFERKPFYRVADITTGEHVEFEADKWESISKNLDGLTLLGLDPNHIKAIKQYKRQYWNATVCNDKLLDKSEAPANSFSYKAITGLRDQNKGVWYGVVWLMMDPQRWANKWLSQIQHILNSNAKGGVMVEEDAVDSISKFREDWAKPNAIVFVNEGANSSGKIKQIEAPRYPDGIDRLLQYAMTAISDAPGVSSEMLGMADRAQAGYLEESRKKAGVTILATFFDSLRRYRKEQSRLLASLIQEHISDGRLIRIVGEDGDLETVPLVFEKDTLKYDIVIDDAPTSTNTKDKVFSILSSLVPQLIQMGVPVPHEIVEYLPIPSSLATTWKELLAKSDGDDSPEVAQQKQMMQQVAIQNAQLDLEAKSINNEILRAQVAETGSKTGLNHAKTQESLAVAADEAAQAEHKMGMDMQANNQKQAMLADELSHKLVLARQAQNEKAGLDYEKMLAEQNRKDAQVMMEAQRKATLL